MDPCNVDAEAGKASEAPVQPAWHSRVFKRAVTLDYRGPFSCPVPQRIQSINQSVFQRALLHRRDGILELADPLAHAARDLVRDLGTRLAHRLLVGLLERVQGVPGRFAVVGRVDGLFFRLLGRDLELVFGRRVHFLERVHDGVGGGGGCEGACGRGCGGLLGAVGGGDEDGGEGGCARLEEVAVHCGW